MSTPKVTLYDIGTSYRGKTISPFVFRIKIILNLKKIPFETRYLQPTEVEPTAKSVGAPPTNKKLDGSGVYTVPFITFQEEGREPIAISDSPIIAEFLEKKYPIPSQPLFPAEDLILHSIFSGYMKEKLLPIFPTINIRNLFAALPEKEAKWFGESRAAITGKALVLPTDEQRGEALKKFEVFFEEFSAHLDKAGKGNYRVTGGAITYAEIELVAWLLTLKVQEGDAWKILESKYGGRFAKLVQLPEYKLL